FFPTAAGTYRWRASYSGDANNNPVAGPCSDPSEATVVTKASPTLATQSSSAVAPGGSVTDTATVAGGVSPTGTVTFTLYGPDDTTCTSTPVTSSQATLSANGQATSAPVTLSTVGTYRWVAAYSGDANNNAADGACNAPNESADVSTSALSFSTLASAGVPAGGQITDQAILAGGSSPTGTVTFDLYAASDTTCATSLAHSTVTV